MNLVRCGAMAAAICFGAEGAQAVSFTDSRIQTSRGVLVTLSFSPLPRNAPETGTFTVDLRGDYSLGFETEEYVDLTFAGIAGTAKIGNASVGSPMWSNTIDGLSLSGSASTQHANSNDYNLNLSFVLSIGLLDSLTRSGTATAFFDLSNNVDHYHVTDRVSATLYYQTPLPAALPMGAAAFGLLGWVARRGRGG